MNMSTTDFNMADFAKRVCMGPTRSYDPHCYDLALLMLSDEPKLKGREGELAAHIQQSLEDWIVYEREHAADSIQADAAADSVPQILAEEGAAR
jgi:hypothetical protein